MSKWLRKASEVEDVSKALEVVIPTAQPNPCTFKVGDLVTKLTDPLNIGEVQAIHISEADGRCFVDVFFKDETENAIPCEDLKLDTLYQNPAEPE